MQHRLRTPSSVERGPLHRCLLCDSTLVYLVHEHDDGGPGRPALLRCPNCGVHRAGVFSVEALEELEVHSLAGQLALLGQLQRIEGG
jgi:hypothetical protein